MTLTEAQMRNDIVRTGIDQVGHLYRDSAVPTNWPPDQFDCSTFQHWLNAKYGIDIDNARMESDAWPPPEPSHWYKYPGYTLTQQAAAKHLDGSVIPYSALKPGDRLYYDKSGEHHVVMFIGGGRVVHAAGTAYGVIVSSVVPPGHTGFGGKTLTMCVSLTRFASRAGYKFAAPPVVTTPKPPPVPNHNKPTVFLSHVLHAINKDGPAAQGHTTYGLEIMLVEKGLYKEGLLIGKYVDGSAGTTSFGQGSAYQKWQVRLGYKGADADGIPGAKSLEALGYKYGFNVVN